MEVSNMTAALQTKNTRPYMMINFDCFESKVFDNQSQRTVYMTLKKFANSNNQCFPSVPRIASVALISVRKVQMTLRELQNKFLIGIEERFRADGSQTSNLYTIYDTPELWTAENAGDTKNVENAKDIKNIENTSNIDNETKTAKTIEQCEELISILEANGYTVIKNDNVPAGLQDKSVLKPASETVPDNTIMAQNESVEENKTVEIKDKAEDIVVQEKEPVLNNAVTMPEKENHTIGKKLLSKLKNIASKEKEPTSEPAKATDVSTTNKLSKDDNTISLTESQPLERYSLDWIKKHFEYDIMLHDNPASQKDIDSVMDILYTALNTTKPTIRINGEDKPSMVVIAKLMKLDFFEIKYSIEKFLEQTDRIKNPTSYMLTILYNAPEQYHLDVSNQVKHDMCDDATKPKQEQLKKNTYQKPKNQFFNCHQRDVTKEEMDELERKLLGLQ